MADTRLDRKKVFIRTLAEILAGPNQVKYSIALGHPDRVALAASSMVSGFAHDWARIREATPLFGYPTIEEAVIQLEEFLL